MCGVNAIKCAATKMRLKSLRMYGDTVGTAEQQTSRDDGIKQFSIQHPTYFYCTIDEVQGLQA